MALGAAQAAGADIGISVTGVAGPTGGDAVRRWAPCIWVLPAVIPCMWKSCSFPGRTRALIRARAAQEALVLALRLAQDKVPCRHKAAGRRPTAAMQPRWRP